MFLPESLSGLSENGCSFGITISIEENILYPAYITIRSDPFTTVPKRVGWTRLVFMRLWQSKEFDGLFFQLGQKLWSDPMVDDFEEPKLLASLYDLGFGIWVG